MGQIVKHNDSWRINFDQEKIDGVEYMSISNLATKHRKKELDTSKELSTQEQEGTCHLT